MNPRSHALCFSFVSSLAVAVVLPLLTAALPAQQPAAGAGDATMLATPRHLFVLRGDVLYQFDVDTMKLRHQVRLPAGTADAPGPSSTEVTAFEGLKPLLSKLSAPDPMATRAAIDHSLAWLAAHQDENGKWDSDEFMKHDDSDAPTSGAGRGHQDVGVTGLALLAFLGDGNTLREGPHREVVKRAVSWLRNQQDDSGLIGTNASHDFIYGHAIATLALSEAYGLSEYKMLRKTVERAIAYLEAHRNPYMVWRYQPRDNDNDTSVTMWCLMAYKSAQDFGIPVNEQAFQLVQTWLDQVTDPVTGRAGYTKRGEPSSRMPGDHSQRFPPERGEALTAAGLFGRFLLGQQPDEHTVMQQSAEQLLKKPPVWDEAAGTIDGYYWFFGSHAMYQMGGRFWHDWSKALLTAVVRTQREDGSFTGSWDPVGVWDENGGRVYSTALMTLALESSYRCARLKGR